MVNSQQCTSYIKANGHSAFRNFTTSLEEQLENFSYIYDNIVIVCIGTDRSTGDSLGPLIGYKLKNLRFDNVYVYGTLEKPVHAKNLEDTLKHIHDTHNKPLIIAIDACLGKMDHIGYVTITKGSLKPGAGTNKELPAVGDISIMGIVNVGGFMEMLVLQNTRLDIVMKMADIISSGIKYVLWKKFNKGVHVSVPDSAKSSVVQ